MPVRACLLPEPSSQCPFLKLMLAPRSSETRFPWSPGSFSLLYGIPPAYHHLLAMNETSLLWRLLLLCTHNALGLGDGESSLLSISSPALGTSCPTWRLLSPAAALPAPQDGLLYPSPPLMCDENLPLHMGPRAFTFLSLLFLLIEIFVIFFFTYLNPF